MAAYLTVGLLIPVIVSKMSGDDGMKFRSGAGNLSGYVLDSLRGLGEIIQYGAGEQRLKEMNNKEQTGFSKDESNMKRVAGRNAAFTNTVSSDLRSSDVVCGIISIQLWRREL